MLVLSFAGIQCFNRRWTVGCGEADPTGYHELVTGRGRLQINPERGSHSEDIKSSKYCKVCSLIFTKYNVFY